MSAFRMPSTRLWSLPLWENLPLTANSDSSLFHLSSDFYYGYGRGGVATVDGHQYQLSDFVAWEITNFYHPCCKYCDAVNIINCWRSPIRAVLASRQIYGLVGRLLLDVLGVGR
mmetsp:Transcript_32558/g.68473  ORF Transcript_32558/g.68473 Transcript_32558/m.68473 type:complete len:114 (-) Transcript_32558:159-500(-)